jgi:hypothetical protein
MNAAFALMVPIGAASYASCCELVLVETFSSMALAGTAGTVLHLSLSDTPPNVHCRGRRLRGVRVELPGAAACECPITGIGFIGPPPNPTKRTRPAPRRRVGVRRRGAGARAGGRKLAPKVGARLRYRRRTSASLQRPTTTQFSSDFQLIGASNTTVSKAGEHVVRRALMCVFRGNTSRE